MEAKKNLVLRSIETPDGGRCVDLFRTPDGSFGFEEYRRDAEDWAVEELSWYPIGYHAGGRYPTEAAAMAAARVAAPWLEDAMEDVMENHGPSDTA
ncbi:MAG: hypothetical protein IIC64_00260 [SAR324 cluster bacterium]|nr:hypothetical protein [SAR324 cluster bacterium]